MKVLILTEGDKNIGFGHITRCIALYQAFQEKGIVPESIINGDESILDLLKQKSYQVVNWIKEKGKLLEIMDGADCVIIDSYLAPKSLYDRISHALSGKLIMIDDLNRLDYPKGIVVNPSIYGNKLNYLRKQGVTYLLGRDYIILRKEFWNVPEKKINKKVKNILITFGGKSHSDLAERIVNSLKSKLDFQFYVVNARKNKLTAKEILNLMLKADICISGGGQTTYELARVGVPTIGICFAENQILNLEGWKKARALEFCGWYNDREVLPLMKKTLNKMNYKNRIKMSKIGQKFVDGQGVKRVVEEILTYAKN